MAHARTLYDDPDPRPQPAPRPEQVLAGAIVKLAVLDAHSRDRRRRQDARAFLHDSDGMLSFWCRVGGLRLEAVRQAARRALARGRRRPPGSGYPRLLEAS